MTIPYFYIFMHIALSTSLSFSLSLSSLYFRSLSFFKHTNFFTYTKNIVVFSCLSLIIVLSNLFLSLGILETFQAISKSEQYPISIHPNPLSNLFLLAAYDYFFFGGKILSNTLQLNSEVTHTHTHTFKPKPKRIYYLFLLLSIFNQYILKIYTCCFSPSLQEMEVISRILI